MSFFGLNIAFSGLRAQQQAMNVTAHNIANANTEGFHRQEASFVSGNPLTGLFAMTGIGTPQLGSGVTVDSVRRMQSDYIDQQVRSAHNNLGMWNYRKEELSQVESIMAEPGELGLSTSLDRFWNSWEELSASPESLPNKISVVENGVALSERITTLYRSLRDLQMRADQDLVDNVAQVNRLAQEIGNINEQIKRSMANGYEPNDLMDRRGLLLDQLSTIVGVQVSGSVGSDMIVAISGRVLVQGDRVNELAITQDAAGWSQVVWSTDNSPARITGGQMAAQLQIRDDVLEGYIQSLNELVTVVTDKVNAYHSTGVTAGGNPAGNFFTAGADASNICVEATLVANPSGVATSTTGNPGDNALAQTIAGLSSEVMANGETIGESYLSLVTRVGAQSREAISHTRTYTMTMDQLRTQRESLSGVSLDEEMLNMVKFQQAYTASARLATTIDEMIEVVVNRLGLAGR